jgi:predicted ArsR family transcriptional regulator
MLDSMDGEQQRAAILEALRGSSHGLDTSRLATVVGLHANTVRWHLSKLQAAGLVQSSPEQRQRRGRPAIIFRLTPEGVVAGRDEYRFLALMLTDALARKATPYETGRCWGRHLHAASPDASVVELLDHEGFAAEETADRILMRRCPFYALAGDAPQVICGLHRGVIDGALAASGSGREVERLDAFVEPLLCIATLRVSGSPVRRGSPPAGPSRSPRRERPPSRARRSPAFG